MFWGLNLKPNRKYSQTTEKSFHISQAALDPETSQGGPTRIFISSENQRFLICTLRKDVCEQVMLDLNFSQGNEICFQSIGSGNVALSGYVLEDVDNFLNGEEEEEEVDDVETNEVDLRNTLNAKKAKNKNSEKKKSAVKSEKDEDDNEEDSDDEDEIESTEDGTVDDDEGDEEEDCEEEEDDDEEDDSEDEEVKQPKAKQPKLEKPEKQQNGVAKQKGQQAEKKSKKELKKEKQQQEKQQKTGGERLLSGGVKVVDVRVGSGAEVKAGKRAHVYYEGRLLSNNKVFDSLKTGSGFKFTLGRGEVIKGWDIGVAGMKVGGKRRITCPPHMAYGSRGSTPAIPPNSTLVFEVELKGVN